MVVMAAVYAQWVSVSGGLGGQQTYTEDGPADMVAGIGVGGPWEAAPMGDGVATHQGFSYSGDTGPQEPHYFPPTLYPTVIPTLAPPPTPVAQAVAYTGQLTEAEMRALLAEAGWPAELIPQALAVSWCESKWSPGAIGDSGRSVGLFQLWNGWFHEGEEPLDVLTNARVALRVREVRGRWGGGGGWSCADHLGIP